MRKPVLIFILLLSGIQFCFSQEEEDPASKAIRLPSTKMVASEVLEYMNGIEGVSVVYESSGDFLNAGIRFKKTTSTISGILDEICDQIPYTYLRKDNYFILKKETLEKQYKLEGKILDEDSNPVFSANVVIPSLNKGQVSSANGNFNFDLPPGTYNLVVTYMGYRPVEKEIILFKDTRLSLVMEPLAQEISEVEIISQRNLVEDKIETGRNIAKINTKDLKQLNLNMVSDVLQGRVTGLWSTRMSGAPGEHQKIHIRGINSLFASTDPLYIIDGLPIPNVNLNSLGIADLNAHDIEEITVYKDASSTAYYGYQGANGVILIETKRGGEGGITFSTKQGIQRMNKRYPLLSTTDFLNGFSMTDSLFNNPMKFYNQYEGFHYETDTLTNENIPKFETVNRYVYPLYNDSLQLDNTDYQDVMFTTGIVSEYQLSGNGNLKGMNYYLSGNIFDHRGVLRNTSYKRNSVLANVNKKFFDRLETGFSYRGSQQENSNNLDSYMGNKVLLNGMNIEPEYNSLSNYERSNFREYDPAGIPDLPVDMNMFRANEMYMLSDPSMPKLYIGNHEDPLDFFSQNQQSRDINIHNLSGHLNYRILPGLEFDGVVSMSDRKNTFLSDIYRINPATYDFENIYFRSSENYRIINQIYSLGYTVRKNRHLFHFAATYRHYRDYVGWEIDSAFNMNIDAIDKSNDGYIRGSNAIYGPSGKIVRTTRSGIAHFRYSYNQKYIISAFANYDKLQEGANLRVTELFPSVALTWDISKEFGTARPAWLESWQIYVNYGKTGNFPLNGLANDLYVETIHELPGDREDALYVSNLSNHYLRHEVLTEKNLGSRISFLNSSITLEADYFIKNHNDLIIERDIPYYYGGGKFMQNIGELSNRGWELSLGITPFNNERLYWTSKFGYTQNNQKITRIIDNRDTILFNNTNILIPDFEIIENMTIGTIKGYKYEGRWNASDDTLNNKFYIERNGFKYYNADTSDFEINEKDKVVIGNSIPKFTMFWNNTFSYKNFSVDMLWYVVYGVDKYNATKAATYYSGRHEDIAKMISDSIAPFTDGVFYESSFFIEDASFIRLKTLNFNYTPRKVFFNKITTSFSISFENLITISSYKGYDPESSIYTDNNFSDNAIDYGAYPSPRGVYLGIELSF